MCWLGSRTRKRRDRFTSRKVRHTSRPSELHPAALHERHRYHAHHFPHLLPHARHDKGRHRAALTTGRSHHPRKRCALRARAARLCRLVRDTAPRAADCCAHGCTNLRKRLRFPPVKTKSLLTPAPSGHRIDSGRRARRVQRPAALHHNRRRR